MGRPFDGLPLPAGPLPPRPPQRPIPRGPSLDLAVEAAKAIVQACKGYHVKREHHRFRRERRSCITYPTVPTDLTAYTGFRKAYTALTFKMPTSQVTALAKTDPGRGGRRSKADPKHA